VKYLSAVVLMELRAGAFSVRDRRLLGSLERPFAAADRILVPSRAIYREAGDVLRQLQVRRGYNLKGRSVGNDVLIALSARAIGATVVTGNSGDFLAIQSVRSFDPFVAA
jgi:predicted nucleic acid-binding protein